MKDDCDKLERSVKHEFTGESLWLFNRVRNPYGTYEALEIKPDQFTLRTGLRGLTKKAVGKFTLEWFNHHAVLAKEFAGRLSELGFQLNVKRVTITVFGMKHVSVTLEEVCPFCGILLKADKGGKVFHHIGWTVYCPNKDCSNKEVDAYGNKIANAVAFLKYKFADKFTEQQNKGMKMSKEGDTAVKAANKRVATQKTDPASAYTSEQEPTAGSDSPDVPDPLEEGVQTAEEEEGDKVLPPKEVKKSGKSPAEPKSEDKKGEFEGLKLPRNKFDRFCLLTLLEGGTKKNQLKKVAAKFPPKDGADGGAYFDENYDDYLKQLKELQDSAAK